MGPWGSGRTLLHFNRFLVRLKRLKNWKTSASLWAIYAAAADARDVDDVCHPRCEALMSTAEICDANRKGLVPQRNYFHQVIVTWPRESLPPSNRVSLAIVKNISLYDTSEYQESCYTEIIVNLAMLNNRKYICGLDRKARLSLIDPHEASSRGKN